MGEVRLTGGHKRAQNNSKSAALLVDKRCTDGGVSNSWSYDIHSLAGVGNGEL